MNVKISIALFAFAALLQLSHSIPTHRFARESPKDFTSKIKEYMNRVPGYGSSGAGSAAAESAAAVGSGSESQSSSTGSVGAGSELHPSIATKEGNSAESGFMSSFQNYIPSFGSYPSQLPSQLNPSQYGQYPSQFPSQLNPSQYMPSSGSAATPSAETPSGAASESHPSVATKEGSSAESGFMSSFQNYIPSFGSYPSQLPSQLNPSQYGQYPSQFPSQLNPSQYMPSSGSAATPSAETPSGAASELHPSVATKEGSSAESGFMSSFQNYIPSFGSYPSQLPSQLNPSQYGQYPSQFPSQLNPSQYMPSSGSAATPSAETPSGAASELHPAVATKEGSSAESGFTSSFQNYIPSFGSYPSQLPSQLNPSQYGQYPSQFPSQFNPSQYMPSSSSSATSTTSQGSSSANA